MSLGGKPLAKNISTMSAVDPTRASVNLDSIAGVGMTTTMDTHMVMSTVPGAVSMREEAEDFLHHTAAVLPKTQWAR